ncbi:unnamed protein product [Rotaria magnacalcarata]|uniref:Uncharacterized protein n=3 Tax=Rotaria magnacalcarata TaxID=392030 RepID=A0A814G850_9BILA|nr:unnamed protein product [Rotaria magnacalcarata]
MAFYGSIFSNESSWADGRQFRPARHIACPQRLKYIHNIKDGYIPYVEDSAYVKPSTNDSLVKKTNRLGLHCIDNAMHDWRQELMGLARQVQSSLVLLNEGQQTRPTRSSRRHYRRGNSSMPNHHLEQISEENTPKRSSNRHQTSRCPLPILAKPKLSIDLNEQESSNINENQDPGIWLLPILCHILHVDNINEAQDWLVNANITEKRLAMELISRTMQDMQNNDTPCIPDLPTSDQAVTSTNSNNVYWPYKLWQHQQQSKLPIENNDTCERATSPVRILTPAKRLATSSTNDRLSTASSFIRSNQNLQASTISHVPEVWRPSTRLLTPMTANNSDRSSRRSYRITTTTSVSTDNANKSLSANLRGKTPLV